MFAICYGVKFIIGLNIVNVNLIKLAANMSMDENYLINSISIIVQIIFGVLTYFGMLIVLKDDYVFKFVDKIKSKIFKKKEVEN